MVKSNQWYKLNEKEFTDILRLVKQQFAEFVDSEKYIESLNRVGDAFTNNKVLYLQLKYHCNLKDYIAWHYRTSYSDFYCGQCLEYKDIMFDVVNGAKTGKRTFITEDWSGTKYEIAFHTWYEVNLREYSTIINGLPAEIRRDIWDEQIEHGFKVAKNRDLIYIMFDYCRMIDDEHCSLSISKTAPKEYAKPMTLTNVSNSSLNDIILRRDDLIYYENNTGAHNSIVHDSDGKRIKDSPFADDDIIKIVRDNKVIYDRQAVDRALKFIKPPANYELKVIDDMIAGDDKLTAEQINERTKKLILNSVYGTSFDKDAFDAMFYANWDTNATKQIIKENKEEKVMEENKTQAITNIINKYRDDADRELTRQHDEQENEIRAKDPNIIALKEYVAVLNKNRKENTEPYNINTFNEIYTAETEMQLVKIYEDLMNKKGALRDLCNEVHNLCMLCDTYEQMRQVLAEYEIIPNTKKRGK